MPFDTWLACFVASWLMPLLPGRTFGGLFIAAGALLATFRRTV